MDRLRGKNPVRFLATLLAFSLGVVVVSPTAQAEGTGIDYGEWLLMHIPGEQGLDVRQAVINASLEGAKSFDEFLNSFKKELESLHDQAPGDATGLPDQGPNDRFFQELRFEFTRFVGDAMLSRSASSIEKSSHVLPDHLIPSQFGRIGIPYLDHLKVDLARFAGEGFGGLSLLSRASAAQPLGP